MTTPGTTQFPTSLPTVDSLFRTVNSPTTTTLNGGISSSDASIILTSAAAYPTSGAIKIDSEIIYYTGKTTNTLTGCVRGSDNTSAASHANGATVRMVNISRMHMVHAEEITAIATKVGTGSSTASTGAVLIGTGSGASAWDTTPAFVDVISQLTGGAVDPLTGPNLVGAQTVKFGTASSVADSSSGDFRQLQSYVINSGTRNSVAATFGVRMDGVGQGWAENPYSYANVSGATAVASEINFGVLASGGSAYGNVFVVVGNFASNAFIQFQSGASGIAAANGIVVNKGGAGLDPISGSFLSFSGGPSMNVGLDMSGGTFSGGSAAPILFGNNSFFKAKDSGGTARIILGIDSNNATLMQSAGGGAPGSGVGWRLLNAANSVNLLSVLDAGGMTVDTSVSSPILFATGANGQSVAVRSLTELTTIAAAATTDTAIQIPADAILLAVNVRVTVAIPTAATFTVIGATSSTGFNTGTNVSVNVNTTNAGTKAGAFYNTTAQSIRITPNLTPGTNAGRVRVTIFYLLSTPPTS